MRLDLTAPLGFPSNMTLCSQNERIHTPLLSEERAAGRPVKPSAKQLETMANSEAVQKRFWSRVAIKGPDECWEWTGTRGHRGYGLMSIAPDGQTRTHRISYAIHKGPIPFDFLVCHTCDNPPCCNPAHLFAGTDLDNVTDMKEKGRLINLRGSKHARSKVTEQQVLEIRADKRSRVLLAKEYGVHCKTIDRIRKRRAWTHL